MEEIKHKIVHQFQPTNDTCDYTALVILLSHYGKTLAVEDLTKQIPQPKGPDGKTYGSITAQLADWCQKQGFQVQMYASDMYILDLSWQSKTSEQINQRLKEIKHQRGIPLFENHWVKVYEDAYISMLDHGVELSVEQFITTNLLNELLKKSPIFANICSSAQNGRGRTVNNGLRKNVQDDINGSIYTHSVVIYGINKNGDYLVADPWDDLIEIEPEKMVLAIQTAQIECDNQIFVINK